MIRAKRFWVVLGLLATLSVAAWGAASWIVPYVAGDTAVWFFNNAVGAPVTGLHIEFDQEVTIVNKLEIGGYMMALGPSTGTVFDFAGGELVEGGAVQLDWQPADAKPVLVQWLSGTSPIGSPYFGSVAILGRLFGEGIVMAREMNPAGLQAAFDAFFLDNEEYLAGLSESLGMSLADSLMPIIMAAPAEGITNFFNTIIGMLGVTSLEDLLGGAVDWGALLALLGI